MSATRQARIVAAALWLTVPALAATSPGIDGPGIPSVDNNPSLNVTQHVMPPPDVTAKEAPPSAVSANPLWAIPMSALAATRGRPLFTPSRRPPAPIVANTPFVAPVRPQSPPAAPEHPNLELIGTVVADNEGVAVFIDNSTRDAVRLRTGEGHMGWILQSIDRRSATLQKNDQTETLELPKSAGQPTTPPTTFAPLPPPPPPHPPPHADAAPAGRQPVAVGCMPEPVGC